MHELRHLFPPIGLRHLNKTWPSVLTGQRFLGARYSQFAFDASRPKEHYDNMEVQQSASHKRIKEQFQKLAMKWHPVSQELQRWSPLLMSSFPQDRNDNVGAHEKFSKINESYRILMDPQQRRLYDRYIAAAEEQSSVSRQDTSNTSGLGTRSYGQTSNMRRRKSPVGFDFKAASYAASGGDGASFHNPEAHFQGHYGASKKEADENDRKRKERQSRHELHLNELIMRRSAQNVQLVAMSLVLLVMFAGEQLLERWILGKDRHSYFRTKNGKEEND
jgi:DnaJ-class molecular chaperone